MSRTIRVIAVGLLVLALASSAYASVPSQSQVSPRPVPPIEASALLEAAWEWILDVFAPRPESSILDRSTEKTEHGSQLDPDGNH